MAKENPSTKVHLISGASAGLISALTLQPLDLLKTRLQQQQQLQFGYRTTITKELKKLSQFKDLWRGVIPSTLRTSIGAGLYFTILSKTRAYIAALRNENETSNTSALPKLSPQENLATGFVVRAFVGFLTMPITVVKTRFESNVYNYNSMYEGFENIYRGETASNLASVKNFFKGFWATMARDCPYAGLYVLFYESFKNDFVNSAVPLDGIFGFPRSSLVNSSSAILAASVATTITAPFDSIKTRLQLSLVGDGKQKSILNTTKLLIQEGGVRNLFSGLSLRLGRKGLSAGISWCIYEELIKSPVLRSRLSL